jgi:hypothetical protein
VLEAEALSDRGRDEEAYQRLLAARKAAPQDADVLLERAWFHLEVRDEPAATLAVMRDGCEVTTVEGLADGDTLQRPRDELGVLRGRKRAGGHRPKGRAGHVPRKRAQRLLPEVTVVAGDL